MREPPELSSREEIFQLRCGCWHPSRNLVAANAGEHDAVPLRFHAGCELKSGLGWAASQLFPAGSSGKVITFKNEPEGFLFAYIYVGAGAAALFFHFGEVRELVPVGFRVVVVGECVEARCFGGAPRDDRVRHADD